MSLSTEATSSCSHCGLPIAGGPAPAPAFCCRGCATVYAALQSCGLGGFYALRDELGGATGTPVADSDHAWLDSPEVLAAHGFVAGDVVLRLSGLHCAACVWLLERLPRALPGVDSARVDFGAATLRVRWDPERIALSTIATFVHDLGYIPQLGAAEAERDQASAKRRTLWRLAVTGALAGNTMLAAFALYAGELATMDDGFRRMFEWLGFALAIPAVTWGAWPFYAGAIAGLRMRMLHMDLPISLGIVAGFAASAYATVAGRGALYFDTVTMLVFLLLLGRHLQSWGQARVRTRSELMTSLVPPLAERRDGAGWTTVPSARLVPGDRVRVAVGARLCADGEVLTGTSHVDLSILTGESRPETVGPGSQVFAGATNVANPLEIVVSAAGETTRVGRILARLCADDERPAAIVRTADRLAGWFVAIVLALAVVGGAAWWWWATPTAAFNVVVSLLVVSCPCALGLATPMALTVARSRAARRGLMLRSGAALEAIARVPHIVLDKTGTLTEGRLEVLVSDLDDAARPLVAALERHSRHPIARALASWAAIDAVATVTAQEEHPGRGLQGEVDGHRVRIGSAAWLGAEDDPAVHAALARAHTPVVVEVDGRRAGVVAVADRPRPEAAEVIARLRKLGKTIAIASGDHPTVVRALADELGITDAVGGCSPEDKARLVAAAAPAAMIGDGINDALAMRRATVGIAVRGGAEAALSVADAYLGDHDLRSVAELFEGARRTQRVVLRNLGFSLVYNVVFASLALAGLITPLVAAILMPISSLTVIGSSFASRTFRAPAPAQTLHEPAQVFPLPRNASDAMQGVPAATRG